MQKAKKRKLKSKQPMHYFNEVYAANYWFFIGWSQASFKAYVNKHFSAHLDEKESSKGECIEFNSDDGNNVVLIWVGDRKDVRAIVHECVHAASFTIQRIGWRHDPDNDEPFAYLVDTIFSKALNL